MNFSLENKILLIDDSATIRRTGELLLKQAGHKVMLAENGIAGLAAVEQFLPDIIFLDVMMPVVNGLDVCVMLKSNPRFKNIPIVMLTSKDTFIDRKRGALHGATQYLVKPFDKGSLLGAIEKVIN